MNAEASEIARLAQIDQARQSFSLIPICCVSHISAWRLILKAPRVATLEATQMRPHGSIWYGEFVFKRKLAQCCFSSWMAISCLILAQYEPTPDLSRREGGGANFCVSNRAERKFDRPEGEQHPPHSCSVIFVIPSCRGGEHPQKSIFLTAASSPIRLKQSRLAPVPVPAPTSARRRSGRRGRETEVEFRYRSIDCDRSERFAAFASCLASRSTIPITWRLLKFVCSDAHKFT